MWNDVLPRQWDETLDTTGVTLNDNQLLLSPSPSSISTSSSLSLGTSSPDSWSTGYYFSFKESDTEIKREIYSDIIHPSETQNNGNIPFYTNDQASLRETVSSFWASWNEASIKKSPFSISPLSYSPIATESFSPSGSLSPGGSVSSYDGEDEREWSFDGRRLSTSSSDEELKDLRCMWIDCKSQFDQQAALVCHIDRHHVEGRKEDFRCFWLGCPRKSRPFNARYKLLIHMRVHTGHKPNKCNIPGCDKAFSRLENLKIHVRSHTGERPYICHRCPKAFSNSSDRAKHQRTHIESKPYRCGFPNCDKKYTDPSSLRKHAKVHFLAFSSSAKEVVSSPKNIISPLSEQTAYRGMPRNQSNIARQSYRGVKPEPCNVVKCEDNGMLLTSNATGNENSTTLVSDYCFGNLLNDSVKCDHEDEANLLLDIDWISTDELRDIEQILSL